jgi:hypothetical protein
MKGYMALLKETLVKEATRKAAYDRLRLEDATGHKELVLGVE